MEQEPSPEDKSDKLINECHECGHLQYLENDNTIIFESQEGTFYAYTRCEMGCDPETIEIEPNLIQFFSYLNHWYDKDGNQIQDFQMSGVVLGEVIDVVDPTEKLLESWHDFWVVYSPTPQEIIDWRE